MIDMNELSDEEIHVVVNTRIFDSAADIYRPDTKTNPYDPST